MTLAADGRGLSVAVPSGSTTYDYRDVFYSPALGSVTVPSTPTRLGAGGTAEQVEVGSTLWQVAGNRQAVEETKALLRG